ncbi:uncharacterized protein LOC127723599 isoform X2 [Mytilus californianus]|nr:uncharacterized protein LOC127723599 isoform X2 [Mytilus californianus]XP_052086252.1 uncharacterized protein LOC127723599 isoform X2 [Mytilus californianus]
MNTRGSRKKRKAATKTTTLETTTRQEETQLPIVTDPVPNHPSTSGGVAVVDSTSVFTNRPGNAISEDHLMFMQTPTYSPSLDDDITLHVSQNLRQKIQRGEYVDLALLLHNSVIDNDKQKVTYEQGQLVINPVLPQTKITNIETWSDAFLIFMSIYCSVHPHKFQELVKYMTSIRKGARRHGGIGWKYYDEQYRLKKARDPSGSWGKLDSEYWMWYMQSASVQPEGQATNHASNNRAFYTNQTATTLRCYSFNFDGICNKHYCIYNHSCLRCGLHHPIISCVKQNQLHGQVSSQTRTEPRFSGPRFTRPRSNFRSPRPNYQPQRPNGRFMGIRQNTY